MQFGTIPLRDAEGAILVHSLRAGGRLFKKGRILGRAELEALEASGIASVMAARLEPGDVPEDVAATNIAQAFAGPGARLSAAFTGRTNLYAEQSGLVVLDPAVVDAVNGIDESVTLATLAPYTVVAPGEMLATVKIIPYAAPEWAVANAITAARAGPIRVAPFQPKRVALISTQLPGQKPSLLDKNRSGLEARLGPLGGSLVFERRTAHEAQAVAEALKTAQAERPDLLFVFGASAITDRRDVIPAGIVAAGGTVLHFGMPVDPGNLLLLGDLAGRPVVGLPSCARSPKVNGFDFVLQRLFADIPVTAADIMRMGVGGLLQEIPSRPQPRDAENGNLRAPRIAALVLAAGLSSRMGSNKLLQEWRGKPLLRWAVEAALASDASPVIVVTGNEAAKVETALKGLDVRYVHNGDYRSGLASSLKTGIAAVPDSADGAIVLLGDMPEINASVIDRMIAAFSPADGRAICIAIHERRRGNPVLWSRAFFPEIATLSGDEGARRLLAQHEELVCEIDADSGVLRDIDTPEALAALRATDSANV
ncbi:MAG TPA: molybdopterin-binding/glycosyltransferase family 2 protein [Micropepsaceae bacterium]|nr:molybdopterin-binding/glycosyltransferase family 2 protein [Micropepsaceae bacterium]